MSLNIYFDGIDQVPDIEVKRNIEAMFVYAKLDGCDYDKAIIRSIEQGEYVDNTDFLDRFGRHLPRQFLSTGTKGALLLYHFPEKLIYGVEIGRNALHDICKYCNRGHLLLPAQNFGLICKIEDSVIDVMCKGRHYTSLHELAEYLMEDAPYEAEIWE